ncbi:uncharacterized protein LAESUDRAFT_710936 [Laetiporus sulphureus 93-53]|uniref:Uncharacterized protein n=1 Tax=Laetiporus sulphureus 93-53 TaxID=1314785 RepID=A0A165H9P7_9APHY|nr:uncharacterized protein LAESUDRAFT_710936 [Laetiporus sulphureus 93-53]KZT11435.1 hypothetical protein LAESUDRAFT_710936 [Laetiporus sulphureus 93-53]
MSRLASFKGPSTPTSSPVRVKQSQSPYSPSRPTESTYHRKVRTALQELRTVAETWDDIVLIDGLKAAKSLVDARTDLDNELSLLPAGSQPDHHIVGPKIATMEQRISDLNAVIEKLKKQFQRMNAIAENLEATLYEAHKTKGWQWVQESMWTTWSLERFVSTIPRVLPPYRRSLEMHIEIVDIVRSHEVTFEASREAIAKWVAQPYLEEHSWDVEWEDLCEAEIDRWDGLK